MSKKNKVTASKPSHVYNSQTNNISKTNEIDNTSESERTEIEPTKEIFKHMYRVRLEWERPDTQIFASPILEDAISYASSHEGYKVYVDDDGVIENDPWVAKKEEPIKNDGPTLKEVIHPIPGHKIILDNTPVFRSALDKHPFKSFTGEFYFYDRTIVNGKAKITKYKKIAHRDPSFIFGYIQIE